MKFYTKVITMIVLGRLGCVSALATFSPPGGPTYSLGIPPTTVAAGTGNIYFQLSASDTYQWVALGIGRTMAGAYIFIIYSDGNGNVTLSARDGGPGHVEPMLDGELASKVQLLVGSGVTGGVMKANVLCTKCPLTSTTTTSSPWIAAWNKGSPIDSTSNSYTINQHDDDSYRQFTYDLTAAAISSDQNPFLSPTAGTSVSESNLPSATASQPSSSSSYSTGNGGGEGSEEYRTSASTIKAYNIAHGTIMGITMVILFPLGAISMVLFGKWWIHAAFQIFSLVMLVIGFGLGVKLAMFKDYLFKYPAKTHTSFGLALFILFFIQPILGLLHHLAYQRQHARGVVGYVHIWYGRVLLILGIINGGLGLQLAGNTKGGEIAYGLIAGLVALAYLTMVVSKSLGKCVGSQASSGRNGEKERQNGERIPMKNRIPARRMAKERI
ncbi:hypothetical protein DSL72_003532 [Monilinia vaccinii-corymbosi]|uniref:DOMON domain-containing protein n=1 Tax=Monilinia vaccinii-corymbosi TaxID=61207 RepID=A0A8A3NX22_9HELO|nr:hypothetical protein DSL72_003532 [Monilinia vaccinii-corymbosi]